MNSVRNFCLIAFILYLVVPLSAQEEKEKFSYSYITDRKFFVPDDFIGYTFFPSEIEYTDGDKDEVKPGEIGFAISPQDLMITGGEFKGIYSIVSIDAARFGFLLKLMDARNPTEQGHLKVILDGKNNVDAFVFKKSRDKQEVIFYQEKINGDLKEAEKKYFTDRNEVVLSEPDSLWGNKILPFLRVSRMEQDRIEREDSVYFEFIEEVVAKEKPPKPEVKEKEEEEVEEEEELAEAKPTEEKEAPAPVDDDEEFIMTDEDEDDDDFIDEDDPLAGMIKKKSKKKKPEPKKEVEEEIIEEEEELLDDAELAAALETEAQEELRNASGKSKKGKGEKIEKAPKERVTYKIVLSFSHWEGEGDQMYRKEEKLEYPIKTWKKLTSSDPKDVNERFLFEFASKPNSILVFLDDNSSISKIQVGSVTYLMRGW